MTKWQEKEIAHRRDRTRAELQHELEVAKKVRADPRVIAFLAEAVKRRGRGKKRLGAAARDWVAKKCPTC